MWDEHWAQRQSDLQGQEKKVKEPWGTVMGRKKKPGVRFYPFWLKSYKIDFIETILLLQMSYRESSRLLSFLFS